MEPTAIQAQCCAVSKRPGAANVTSLTGHLPGRLKCSECGDEYTVDYDPQDANRISNFENRLRVAAQRKIDGEHPLHGPFVSVLAIEGAALQKAS